MCSALHHARCQVLPAGNAAVYGTATPGSKVSVTVESTPPASRTFTATTSDRGSWTVDINITASLATHTITVATVGGAAATKYTGVLFGTVLLCAGQCAINILSVNPAFCIVLKMKGLAVHRLPCGASSAL